MELFREIGIPLITLFVGGGATWFWGNYKTQKQAKKSDLDNFSSSIEQLTASIDKLTAQNGELVAKLCVEQDKNLKLVSERGELLEKIETLQKEVNSLTRKINRLLKNEKDSDI